MEEKVVERRAHKLELRARNKGSITGVSDVLCFDEEPYLRPGKGRKCAGKRRNDKEVF